MSPEYLEELAERADPDELWKKPPMLRMDMSIEMKAQLDTGVALRRYAAHIQALRQLQDEKRSLLITPLSDNCVAHMSIDTPAEHERLRQYHIKSPIQYDCITCCDLGVVTMFDENHRPPQYTVPCPAIGCKHSKRT